MGVNHQVNEQLVHSSKQYERLSMMHARLEREIDALSRQVTCDDSVLKSLKCRKLQVADQMSNWERIAG